MTTKTTTEYQTEYLYRKARMPLVAHGIMSSLYEAILDQECNK